MSLGKGCLVAGKRTGSRRGKERPSDRKVPSGEESKSPEGVDVPDRGLGRRSFEDLDFGEQNGTKVREKGTQLDDLRKRGLKIWGTGRGPESEISRPDEERVLQGWGMKVRGVWEETKVPEEDLRGKRLRILEGVLGP